MKLVIIFIILSVILLTGILVLMKPSAFNSLLSPYGNSPEDQSAPSHLVSKEIIILGSTFAVIGLVGLSILGFIIVRLSKEEETME
jgi:multisubunit Na+/H+ antiporter MnhB subunit